MDENLCAKVIITAYSEMIIRGIEKLRPENIVCMGIRNGNEYNIFERFNGFFYEMRNANIFGVDINPRVKDVGKNCFCHDFQSLPRDWENLFDIIYSNSIDHAFNILKTLDEWWRVGSAHSFIILTLPCLNRVSKTDIYDFTEDDAVTLFDQNKFEVKKIWREVDQKISFNVLIKIKK